MNRIFPGVRPPSVDLQATRDGRRALPLYFEASLASARSLANGTTSDVTDASGKALQLNIAGTLFYADPLVDATGVPIGGVAVAHFQDSALGTGISTPLTLQPGSRLLIPFTQVIIENPAQAGRKLRGVYGVDIDVSAGFNGFDVSDRASRLLGITYGSIGQLVQIALHGVNFQRVEVQGDSDADTDGNFAFARGARLAATAAVFNHSQVFNPNASGKTVYIDGFRVSGLTTNERFDYGYHNTQLTTDVGAVFSKNSGGADASAHIRSQTNGTQLGTPIGYVHCSNLHEDGQLVRFRPAIRLDANKGFIVASGTVNVAHEIAYEIREY